MNCDQACPSYWLFPLVPFADLDELEEYLW